MDPLVVLRTLWRHRVLALPLLALICLAAVAVTLFGPRTYQSSATYVLINPKTPTEVELAKSARLRRLNSDNPYLRSSDPSLAVSVLVSTLSSDAVARELQSAGLGPDYAVERSASNSMLVVVTGYARSPETSLATMQWLGQQLGDTLHSLQKVNGADDLYLVAALPVDVALEAEEKVSSRLRAVILVLVGGVILLFAVVALGQARDSRRSTAGGGTRSAAVGARGSVLARRVAAPAVRPNSLRDAEAEAVDWSWDSSVPTASRRVRDG
jgi:hypothetical protein